MAATLKTQVDVVKVLLQAGADVNVRALDGRTALTLAKQSGHTELVSILEKAGAIE
jgi:ankyrin repeat protein